MNEVLSPTAGEATKMLEPFVCPLEPSADMGKRVRLQMERRHPETGDGPSWATRRETIPVRDQSRTLRDRSGEGQSGC